MEKICPWADAFDEMERLKQVDISLPTARNSNDFEIVSLNTRSLPTHFEDIKADMNMMSATVLPLQETSLFHNLDAGNNYDLAGKNVHFTSQGRNKGVATYFPAYFDVVDEVSHEKFQMTTIANCHMKITNVYRSTDAGADFLTSLADFVEDDSQMHIIMGETGISVSEMSLTIQ